LGALPSSKVGIDSYICNIKTLTVGKRFHQAISFYEVASNYAVKRAWLYPPGSFGFYSLKVDEIGNLW
jgi:hypothetical protein